MCSFSTPCASRSVSATCIASENASCAARYARSPARASLRCWAAAASSSTIAFRLFASPASSSRRLACRRMDRSPPATCPAKAAYSRTRTATRRTSSSTASRLSRPNTSATDERAGAPARPGAQRLEIAAGRGEVLAAEGLLGLLQPVERLAQPVAVGLGVDLARTAGAHDALADRQVGGERRADAVDDAELGALEVVGRQRDAERLVELRVAAVELAVDGARLARRGGAHPGVRDAEVVLGGTHRRVGVDALGELALDGGGAVGGVIGRVDGDPRDSPQGERERHDRDGGLADDAGWNEGEAGHAGHVPR